MADLVNYLQAELVADTDTDITGGGLDVGEAGTYSLNLVNDSDADIVVKAIRVTNGEAAANKHKVHPQRTVSARDYFTIQPLLLGEGYKVFVEAGAAISVQLLGRKEA